jgi:hypothetical protein
MTAVIFYFRRLSVMILFFMAKAYLKQYGNLEMIKIKGYCFEHMPFLSAENLIFFLINDSIKLLILTEIFWGQ